MFKRSAPPSRRPRAAAGRAPEGRSPARRWMLGGVLVGVLLAVPAFAPAAWLAQALDQASHGRLQLAEPAGTLWQGSGLPVLAGAAGSRDAAVLPTRLHWTLSPFWGGLRLRLTQDGHLDGPLLLDWRPGWRTQQLSLAPEQARADEVLGHWPAAWLEGLGAPLNTLRPGGDLQLAGHALGLVLDAEGWHMTGTARLELLQASSRLASVEPLGSYRVVLTPAGNQRLSLVLSTLDGALRLSGSGEIGPRGLRLRAEAQAAPGAEAGLNNLLNIIGRRDGALSRLSIG